MSLSEDKAAILVLLPTYNGANFLAEQLESLLFQQHSNLSVLCRDDGSSDSTPALLDEFAQREPERFSVIHDDRGNLGACGSFSWLMQIACRDEYVGADYIALADQDDIWHPQRLSRCLAAMREQEALYPGKGIIVHSDLRVVSEQGELMASSMAGYQGLQPQKPGLAPQLLSNAITGCTALMNRTLLEEALPVPEEAIMHDWWLSLVASAFGRRHYIDQALVDYRQHDNNTVGARLWEKPRAGRGLLKRLFDRSNQQIFEQTAAQARVFRQRYASRLPTRSRVLLRLIERLGTASPPLQKVLFRSLRKL